MKLLIYKKLFMRSYCILIALSIIPFSLLSQLHSIRAYSDYSYAIGKRMAVNTASAVGGGVTVKFTVTDNFVAGFSGGYKLYSLSQTDQLRAWNWDFWNNRYSNTIKSNIQADPNLSVEIGSFQKMDMLPALLFVEYLYSPIADVVVQPSLASGVVFFTRRMYAVETWSKKFDQANYVFTYSYRNFAPYKKGNVLEIIPGCSITYKLFSTVSLTAGIHYTQYVLPKNFAGVSEFPLDNEVNLNFGLDFTY